MSNFLSLTYVNGAYLARAIAIVLVVANHSSGWYFGGGMNFLLMLAGYNLAAFSFGKKDLEITKDMFSMVSKVLFPATLIIIFYFLMFGKFSWSELLMVKNIFGRDVEPIALFPSWYCQVLLQIALITAIFFNTIRFSKLIQLSPIAVTCCVLVLCCAINYFSGTEYPWLRYPHLYLWNFTLGWFIWALLSSQFKANKLFCTVTIMVVAALMFMRDLDSHPQLIYRAALFTALCVIFFWVERIKLPTIIALLVNMSANATLIIYLLHKSFIELYDYTFSVNMDTHSKEDVIVKFALAMLGPMIIWLLIESFKNTRKAFRQLKIAETKT